VSPYAPPRSVRDARPAAIFWYRAYAGLMTLAAFALLVLGIVSGGTTALAMIVVSLLLAVFYGLATFVPFRPWGWTVGLVAIALGLAGGSAIFAIPLIMFWFKPDVKAAFARL
jgi:hypothetical protein